MPMIQIEDFTLKKGTFSLRNIRLQIQTSEFFAVLGKTGSGKTLLLESMAGYYRGNGGIILVDGESIVDIPLEKRRIGFVYQDFGLFPHMTVFDNIGFGLRMRRVERSTIVEKVSSMAEIFSIGHILRQYPGTLSGGEQQRTALARALVLDPRVLLLDEPFSALDPVTRGTMHEEIRSVNREFDCTVVLVTHDIAEAQMLADRVGILANGQLKAVRSSADLLEPYDDPSINQFLGLDKTRPVSRFSPFRQVGVH